MIPPKGYLRAIDSGLPQAAEARGAFSWPRVGGQIDPYLIGIGPRREPVHTSRPDGDISQYSRRLFWRLDTGGLDWGPERSIEWTVMLERGS